MEQAPRAAVVTVSDGVTAGTRRDESGDVAEELLRSSGFEVVSRSVVPDERGEIEARLRQLAADEVHLVATTGGTGFGPRDVTPEVQAVMPVLPHALELLGGQTGSHPTGHQAPEARAPTDDSVVATAVKVHGSPPCRVGQRMTIGPGGPLEGTLGCAEFDAGAVADASEILRGGRPETRTYHHELGDVEVFLEPRLAPPRLLVVSANPISLELLRLGRVLGYRTVLVEPREERITPEHRAAADATAASLDGVEANARTDAVHTDHDAPGVVESIAALLRSPARFVGVMGSRRHVGPHVEALKRMGFADEDLARVRSPVGLDIGARTPPEIAVSIAAGLIAARSERTGGWLDR